ncbi:hypothetical protein R3P38DRAFT_2949524 [Favolaschia claudopus]|uniref:Uncharacterized protein n=1 Tax=Favolaschia claudopus TaxID=2862362 RepID=A0AAW0BKW4_9AGAR
MRFFLSLISAVTVLHQTSALTPVGHTPSGKPMYVVPNKSRIQQVGRDLKVFAPNGTVIETFANVFPQRTGKRNPATLTRRQGLSNVAAFVPLNNTNAMDMLEAFNTTFTVPPSPTTFESQLLWFAASVVLPDENGVPMGELRTLLQYGATVIQGGPFWTIAAQFEWFPDAGGLLQGSPIGFDPNVDVGTAINTSIARIEEDFDPSLFWYEAGFYDDSDAFPQLELGVTEPAITAVIGMEEEGALQSSDYPPEPFRFTQTDLTLGGGFPEIEWDVESDPSAGAYVTVDVDGSKDAEIAIRF